MAGFTAVVFLLCVRELGTEEEEGVMSRVMPPWDPLVSEGKGKKKKAGRAGSSRGLLGWVNGLVLGWEGWLGLFLFFF